MASFLLNENHVDTGSVEGIVLLDYLRLRVGLTGTREGCREGECGACMVLMGRLSQSGRVDYRPVNSCLLPLDEVHGCHVVTIEGQNSRELNPIQQAVVEEGAAQCGFCTSGMIIAMTGFLLSAARGDGKGLLRALDGNICRCTGYHSILRAFERVMDEVGSLPEIEHRVPFLVEKRFLPPYFLGVSERLAVLAPRHRATHDYPDSACTVVAGGTDLFCQDAGRALLTPSLYLSMSDREGLQGVLRDGDCCRVGAMTTVEDMRTSADLNAALPGIGACLDCFGSTPIRERATLGGNLVNASPVGDLAIIFLALDATLHLQRMNGPERRDLPLRDFYNGYKQVALQPGEIVQTIGFCVPGPNERFHFEKVSRRPHMDVAAVNSALWIHAEDNTIRDIRISAGGVGPVPLLLREAPLFLRGRRIEEAIIGEGAERAAQEVSPITDVRGSASYKRLLLRQLMVAHFHALFPQWIQGGSLC